MSRKRKVHAFTAVDSQEDPRSWVKVLDKLHREPFYVAYKTRVFELLKPQRGGTYLEIGAGTGDDARAVAKAAGATVFVIDISLTMMSEARRRGLQNSVVGDVVSLPFAENTFDGCWADRTFQHLADPEQALREIVRVTKPAGRIVVVDPDYATQVMEFPDQELAHRVLRFRADCGLRNGTLAHRMQGMFVALGLSDVRVEPMTLVVRDPTAVDNVMGLRTWARSAQKLGYVSEEDVIRWEALFDETVAAGRFMYAVTFFLTAGAKPA